AGLVIAKDPEIGQQIRFYQNACGAVLGPFDSFLLIRGLETLHLRVKQHTESASRVASFLKQHKAVAEVFYPGFGGVVSFRLKQDNQQAATRFVSNTRLFHLAESLGGVKSLISHPASMTHKSVDAEKRLAA